MTNTQGNPPFICPTSGQALGAVVTAFRLHLSDVGGESAEFIGNGDAGKRARDYFEGKWVPDATRQDICTWIIKAVLHSEMLPNLRLPATPSCEAPEIVQALRMALFTWLQVWDGAYVASAARWPAADAPLAGFVIGRQTVIDLALRWGAVCHFAGIDSPEAVILEDGRAGKGKAVLDAAMKLAGSAFTREALAKALRREQGSTVNDRTVDRWFDSLVVPDDVNLVAMSQVLAKDPELQARLLRFLRLQYGTLRLGMIVREHLGPRLSGFLVDGLLRFVRAGILFNKSLAKATSTDQAQTALFELANLKLLMMGSGDQVAQGWINAFLGVDRGPVWHDDLQYAGNDAAGARVSACLKGIGDLPRVQAAIARGEVKIPEGMTLGRAFLETVAIWGMNDNRPPPGIAKWMAENPESVAKIAGSAEQMKAALQAEQGTAALNVMDYDTAIPHWAQAVALETNPRRKANYLFHHAVCLWQGRAHRFDDAIEALRESFRIWPDLEPFRDRPFVEIAIIYQNREWFDRALQHLDTDPAGFEQKSGHFNFVKGRTLHALHRWLEALVCFEKAILLKTDSLPDAYQFAADAAFELNSVNANRELAQKARNYAKQALHLGRPEAHDKWKVG